MVDAGGAGFLLLLDVALHVVDGRPVPEPEPTRSTSVGVGHSAGARDRGGPRRGRPGRPALRGHVLPRGPRRVHSRRSRTCGPASATRSWWSAATASGTATSTPTTSARRSRRPSTSARRGRSGSPTCSSRSRRSAGCARPSMTPIEPAAAQRAGRRAPSSRWPPATASAASSTRSACRCIVTGGQTMNPSTAQLLEAVEAAPADEVVILPNNKNIIPVAEQVDAETAKTVRVVPTRGVAEGFASLLAYDPEAAGVDNAKAMVDAAAHGGGRRGHPGRARLDLRPRPDRRGRLPRHRPRRHPRRRRRRSTAACDAAARPAGRPTSHEIVTIIEGEGATPAFTRHIEVWLAGPPPRGRRRDPPRRPAALPVPLRHRVRLARHEPVRMVVMAAVRRTGTGSAGRMSGDARRLARLAELPVTELKGVGRRRAEALAKLDVADRARPADLLPPPLPRPHQPGGASTSSAVGEEAMVLVTRASVASRQTRNRRRMVVVDVTDGTGHLQVTFFNQPLRERQLQAGDGGGAVRQARGVPRPAADDEPGGRPGRRQDRPHRPGVPAVREGRRHELGRRQVDGRGAPAGRRRSPIRCRRRARTGSTSIDRTDRVPRHPRARVDGPGVERPAAPGVRRAAAGAAASWCSASASSSATTPGHRPRRRRARSCAGSTSGCPSR